MSHIPQFFVICIVAVMLHLAQPRKILLEDLRTLTLRHGEWTTSRRSSPVPQLKCVGGTAGCYAFVPQHVQCYNRGSDGYDIQWECKTEMNNKYRFGKIDVTCEGYEYADDPYVLAGSCGLEYTIDKLSNAQSSAYYSQYDDHNKNYQSGLGSAFGFICVIMIIFFVYRTCYAGDSTYPNASGTGTEGFTSGNQYDAPPPPYGFRPEYQQQQQKPYTTTGHQNAGNPNNNGQPGFFSGLLAGGLMGYLFGNNRSGYSNYYNPSYESHGFQRDWFGSPIYSGGRQSSFDRFTDSSSRTSSGFGGTKRR